MEINKKTVILAAGGTGGHIFPALSLGKHLIDSGKNVLLITDERFYNIDARYKDIKVFKIKAGSMSGTILKKIKGLFKNLLGLLRSTWILKKHKPDLVIGFGGYPSFPTMIAAGLCNVDSYIHEQNSTCGRVNKIFLSKVKKIATSFETVLGIEDKYRNKIILTGNPVREEIIKARENKFFYDTKSPIKILVIGGSQGAKIFSQVIPEAIMLLSEDIKSRLMIMQQCRKEDVKEVRQFYIDNSIDADIDSFFNNMNERLSMANIVIARSGASTIAELTVVGRPSILIPFKYAMDDHQTHNAKYLEKKNASIMINEDEFTPQTLYNQILALIMDNNMLNVMAENAYKCGNVDSIKKLALAVNC